jgi:hypothetical protein
MDERQSFTSRWACFEAKSGVRRILHVKCSKISSYTSKYVQQERKYGQNRRNAEFCEQLVLF